LHVLSRGKNIQSLVLRKKGLAVVLVYLCVLYGVTTVFIFPERLPKMILPYVLIFLWYLVALSLLWTDRFKPTSVSLKKTVFSQKELSIFALLVVSATTVCSLVQQVSYGVLLVMFISLMGAGVILFAWSVFSLMKQRISQGSL
jgi:hypothetical protein